MRRLGHAFAVASTSSRGIQAEVAGHHAHNAVSVVAVIKPTFEVTGARQDAQSENRLHVTEACCGGEGGGGVGGTGGGVIRGGDMLRTNSTTTARSEARRIL